MNKLFLVVSLLFVSLIVQAAEEEASLTGTSSAQYEVSITIRDLTENSKSDIISSSKLILDENKPAELNIGFAKDGSKKILALELLSTKLRLTKACEKRILQN